MEKQELVRLDDEQLNRKLDMAILEANINADCEERHINGVLRFMNYKGICRIQAYDSLGNLVFTINSDGSQEWQ